jgi:hypothetical protein
MPMTSTAPQTWCSCVLPSGERGESLDLPRGFEFTFCGAELQFGFGSSLYVAPMRDGVGSSRIPMRPFASSGLSGTPLAPVTGRMHMTPFHTHPAKGFGSRGFRSGNGFSAARATRKIIAALQTMHRAIIAAKLRRLRNELMLHGRAHTLPGARCGQNSAAPAVVGRQVGFLRLLRCLASPCLLPARWL